MDLKKIFFRSKLNNHLVFSQKGNIWRMFFTNNNLIVGETRDILNKHVYFFVLNYETGDVFKKNFQLDEKWWISISGANERFIYLSSYRKPDLPEYLGITTVNTLENSVQWKNNDLTFLFTDDKYVYAYRQLFETKKYYRLNPDSGEIVIEITGGDEINSIMQLKQKLDAEHYKDFIYPQIYNPENQEYNNRVSEYFTSRFSDSKINGFVEYITFNNLLVYNFHEVKGIEMKNITKKMLANKLEVYDTGTNETVYEVVLNRTVSSYVPDSFFIKDSYLFFVKEKTEIISVELKK